MKKNNTEAGILKLLLAQFSLKWTITALSIELKISRVGIWKALKKLENERLILISPIGKGKTSAFSIGLNWGSTILEKKLALILAEEASKHQRWISNFEELENISEFVILYGSILHSTKEANDIDILVIARNKKDFIYIDRAIQKIQKTQLKKIHSEGFTQTEFKEEINKPNKVFVDTIKKGVVLFGHERFIKFIKGI